jgi:hypothetical protein
MRTMAAASLFLIMGLTPAHAAPPAPSEPTRPAVTRQGESCVATRKPPARRWRALPPRTCAVAPAQLTAARSTK